MTKQQWEELAERSAATFWQGAIAAAPVTVAADWGAVRAALIAMAVGGGAALLSAVKSTVRAKRSVVRS